MTKKTGGMMNRTNLKLPRMAVLAAALMMTTAPAIAAETTETPRQQVESMRDAQHPARFLSGFFTAAIDAMNHAARSTSDTLHHNTGNVMDTVAKARGFVRDTVSGVLGNARKATGMVGDMMPFTEHHHYEAGAAPQKKATN